MELKDIELKNGDIVTKIDGRQTHVNLENDTYLMDTIYDNIKDKITKIQRYETFKDKLGQPARDCHKGAYYILKTIWERKEETDDIEEISDMNDIYKIDTDLSLESFIAWQKANNEIFKNKLNEIIRKLKKKDSDK